MTSKLGTTKAEVIRNALALYAYLLEQLKPEFELAIAKKDTNQVVKAIIVPGIAFNKAAAANR